MILQAYNQLWMQWQNWCCFMWMHVQIQRPGKSGRPKKSKRSNSEHWIHQKCHNLSHIRCFKLLSLKADDFCTTCFITNKIQIKFQFFLSHVYFYSKLNCTVCWIGNFSDKDWNISKWTSLIGRFVSANCRNCEIKWSSNNNWFRAKIDFEKLTRS